jgi:hypothetical protein
MHEEDFRPAFALPIEKDSRAFSLAHDHSTALPPVAIATARNAARRAREKRTRMGAAWGHSRGER